MGRLNGRGDPVFIERPEAGFACFRNMPRPRQAFGVSGVRGAYRSLQNGLSSTLKSRAACLLDPVWRIQPLCGCLQSGLAF